MLGLHWFEVEGPHFVSLPGSLCSVCFLQYILLCIIIIIYYFLIKLDKALVENPASASFCSHMLSRRAGATGRIHSFCWTSLYYHSPLFDPLTK